MNTVSPFRLLSRFGAWFMGVALAAQAADTTAGKPGEAVRMSPYEVSANSVEFVGWIKVASPHFILYTDTKLSEATGVLREFEMLRIAAQRYFRRPVRERSPAILVLPTSRSDWRKIASKGAVQWKVAVSHPAEELVDLILCEYDWQDRGIFIARASYGAQLLRELNIDAPFWLKRGVGSLLETAEFKGNSVVLGRQNPRTRSLASQGWLPWGKFFKVNSGSPEFVKEFEVHRFEAQCAVFVHFLMTNSEPVWVERLMTWLALLKAGNEPTEDEFKRVFGQDWKTWQKTMEAYLNTGRYQIITLPLPPELLTFTSVQLDCPVREMRELFVISQILNQHIPASDQALDSVLAKGLKSDSLRELLAEACFSRERSEAGLAELKKLVEAGSTNAAVHTLTAMHVFLDRVPKPSIQSRLGGQADEIRTLCRRALELDPREENANNVLALTEALGPNVDAATIGTIERIHRQLAGDVSTSDVLIALAIARWRAGEKVGARTLAERLVSSPYADRDARSLAMALLGEIGER